MNKKRMGQYITVCILISILLISVLCEITIENKQLVEHNTTPSNIKYTADINYKSIFNDTEIVCNEYNIAYYVFYTDRTRMNVQSVVPVLARSGKGVDCDAFVRYKNKLK